MIVVAVCGCRYGCGNTEMVVPFFLECHKRDSGGAIIIIMTHTGSSRGKILGVYQSESPTL